MATELPEIPAPEFERRLRRGLPEPPPSPQLLTRLLGHYHELRRWNPSVALVGPRFAEEAVEEHYAESLAAVGELPQAGSTLVDVGSGAGFPGLILAAARPDLVLTLVEARERKCAFLRAAARRMGLRVEVLNATVREPPPQGLPPSIDVVTARAVRLESSWLRPLLQRLSPHGRVLLWSTEGAEPIADLRLLRRHALRGRRAILVFEKESS